MYAIVSMVLKDKLPKLKAPPLDQQKGRCDSTDGDRLLSSRDRLF